MTLNKSVISPVLIGRADDLAVVNRLMEQAAQGHGQIGLISGEAGIGKSRLVLEAIQHASELDLQVLKGNCFETDRALPYAPLLDLLRTFRSEHRGKDLSAYFKSTSRELAKILPELAEIVHHNSSAPALEPEQEKYRLFQALAQFLIERSKDTLLIVIEDLHWCDETSLDFLLYFTRYLQNQPILLLLTYRSDEVNPALGHFLAELDRQRLAIELALSRLSAEEINAMLRAIFDLNRPIRPEFINILYPLTEGNPFFIEEILKSLIVAGEIFYSDGTWDRRPIDELSIPRSVQDAVRRRAEQLSASAKDILSLAAVMGQRFDFSLLRDLTALDDDELLKLIKELIAVQLITEESGERFVFRHALTREAIYSQLMERERRNLHKKIGESIERLGENSLDEQTANLAYHFYQANAWQKAMQYSERAGQNAQRLYAPRAAIEHLTHAIDSARHLSLLPSSGVYRARGSAHETLGDFEQARADYESALQSSISIQDQRKEWLSLLDLGALWTGRDYSEAGKYYQRAYELACDINDSELLAHTLNRLGNWSVNIERPDEGLRYHKKALELFESLKDQKGLAETFDLLGMANYIHGDLIQSENYYQQAVEIFRELDDRAGLTSSLASMMLNNSHLQSGIGVPAETKHENAMQGGEEALRIAREIGWRSGEVYAITILGNFLAVKGEYSKALDLANASLAIAEEIEHSQWMTYSRYSLGALYLDLMAYSQAQEQLDGALKLANQIGSRWWITNITGFLALLHISKKDFELAASALDAALGISVDSFLHEKNEIRAATMGQRLCWYACAQLALARDDADTALYIVDQLLDSSANLTEEGLIPRLGILRGEALAVFRRTAEAEKVLLATRKVVERQSEKPYLWRIYVTLGKVYQLSGQREDALSAFAIAQTVIAELSTKIPDDSLRENFAKHALALLPGSQKLSPRQVAKQESGGLTEREREVAQMVAQGKSNHEIAGALVVSERTVETHVGNILTKLGFSSRSQVAAWVVEKGLLKEN